MCVHGCVDGWGLEGEQGDQLRRRGCHCKAGDDDGGPDKCRSSPITPARPTRACAYLPSAPCRESCGCGRAAWPRRHRGLALPAGLPAAVPHSAAAITARQSLLRVALCYRPSCLLTICCHFQNRCPPPPGKEVEVGYAWQWVL